MSATSGTAIPKAPPWRKLHGEHCRAAGHRCLLLSAAEMQLGTVEHAAPVQEPTLSTDSPLPRGNALLEICLCLDIVVCCAL